MAVTKPDRRISRTRRQLRDALMALILEKGYDAVTIEDITERADLGRTTFYLHYRDKEELLLESLDAIAEDLKSQVDTLADWRTGKLGVSGGVPNFPTHNAISLAFRHAAENATLYRIILKGEGATKAASLLRQIISDAALEFFTFRLDHLEQPVESQVPVQVVASYFASALLGFMTWWLEKDMPYSPDQMAEMFVMMFFQGSRQVMGLSSEM